MPPDLLESLRPLAAPITVIDLGMSEEQRAHLDAYEISIVSFSYPLDYPARRQVETIRRASAKGGRTGPTLLRTLLLETGTATSS